MKKIDVTELNEVFETAVIKREGNTFEVLQLMEIEDLDEHIEEVRTIKELMASIPVIGHYQYVKATFTPELKRNIANWDTDATDLIAPEEWIQYVPENKEQVDELTDKQLYELLSIYLVDLYSYTSFEEDNILEDNVEVREGV